MKNLKYVENTNKKNLSFFLKAMKEDLFTKFRAYF